MKALVVGASGYLGSAICLACERAGIAVSGVSRRGDALCGERVAGDVRRPDLGLAPDVISRLREEVSHAVLCFGSVSWAYGPTEAIETHDSGMRSVLRFLEGLPRLEKAVHVSSLLVLGRAKGRLGNRELYVGQDFRNWYEYAKNLAERRARDADGLPMRIVRFGPVLGPDVHGRPLDTTTGLLSAVPYLLAGFPAHLRNGGRFPCYVTDVSSAAEVVLRALQAPGDGQTWSWFDPVMPTVADVLREICRPWGVMPKLVDLGRLGRFMRHLADPLGMPQALTDYAEPWFDVDPAVLATIPGPPPKSAPDYLAETGRALRYGGKAEPR